MKYLLSEVMFTSLYIYWDSPSLFAEGRLRHIFHTFQLHFEKRFEMAQLRDRLYERVFSFKNYFMYVLALYL